MRFLSVCSGIDAASVAWSGLDWECAALSEIEKFPSAVLKVRFPKVRNLGDMNGYGGWDIGNSTNILVGGTPCQSFSVAGLRKGLDDPRGNLALVYCGLLERFKPKWFVWENVPGVLSSGGGRDFGSFLGAVAKLGYGFAYRVLDAQFFGVPQRRRRVFVVGHLGDWRCAAAVLFERESMCRDSAKGKGKKQDVAKSLRGRANSSHREDSDNFVTHSLRAEGFDASEDGTGRGTPLVPTVSHTCLAKCGSGRLDPSCETFIPTCYANAGYFGSMREVKASDPLRSKGGDAGGGSESIVACTLPASDGGVSSGMHPVIAIQERAVSENPSNGPGGIGYRVDGKSYTLEGRGQVQAVAFNARQDPDTWLERVGPIDTDGYTQAVSNQIAVRRLTPLECERLQGFPDDWTAIKYRGKPAADGPRYKAIGNSMAVVVMRWIGERINMQEWSN